MRCLLHTRCDLLHERLHVFNDAFAVVIEEVEPQHQTIVRVETLQYLLADILGIADDGVVGCFRNLVWVQRALERRPVGPQGIMRLLLRPARGGTPPSARLVR